MRGRGLIQLGVAMSITGSPGQAVAQTMTAEAATFDPARAMLSDSPMFDAFYPTTTERLADALKSRDVREDTGVLVVEVAGRRLALVTRQMAYHHVAQGEMAGEPWLVTF